MDMTLVCKPPQFLIVPSCSMQVCSNGLISFGYPFIQHQPQQFPITEMLAVIAPFWSNVNIGSGVGNIYYHLYTDTRSSLLLRASKELSQFTGDFNSTWLMVVTWDGVPQYGGSLTQVSILH